MIGATVSLLLLFNLPKLPELPREFRGVWVATVDNIDWPIRRGEPTEVARRELHEIVLTAARLHLNAILLQVRPSADALYRSRLEPWSEYLTGQQGKAPAPKWDPLEVVTKDAHAHGIELHAWFNPFRAESPAQKGPSSRSHVSRRHPNWVKKYGSYSWLDPGEPDARKHSLAVFMDVVKRYDVDGIVIDDYFYPYKEKGPDGRWLDFPDDASWQKYQLGGGQLGREDWRRGSVNTFVKDLYTGIKQTKPWVKFGISPFGIYRSGYPTGIHSGVDQFADLYADARLWLENGWCDYFAPQLYWPLNQKPQAFVTLLRWWLGENIKGRHLWPALNTEGLGRKSRAEIPNQILATRQQGSFGTIHFSFKIFRQNGNDVAETLLRGPYHNEAAVPESPWLAHGPPATARFDHEGHDLVTNRETRWIYWSRLVDGKWTPWTTEKRMGGSVAALPIDHFGRAGKPAFHLLPSRD